MGLFNSIRMGASGAADTFQIERSVRISRDSGNYFSVNNSSSGNTQTFTFSFWMKLGKLFNNFLPIYSHYLTGSNRCGIVHTGTSASSAGFQYQNRQGNSHKALIDPAEKLRDHSAWYHVVFRMDTTNSTQNNRFIIYVNGREIAQDRYIGVTQNSTSVLNSATTHYIGHDGFSGTGDFYLADIHLIDGQALDASYFAETDATTGQWMPKEYTGSYSGTSYHLKFDDNSGTTATTLGKDSSGLGNNVTPVNFSVAAGDGNDSLEDTPTKNFCTINPLDTYRSGNTLAEGNLKLTRSGSNFGNARGTFAVNSGKWYYEWKCTGQHTQVGWVNTGFNINYNSGDVAVTSSGGNGVGMYWDSRTFMYGWQNSGGNDYFPSSGSFVSYTTGDIIMVAFDVDNFKFWFGKNGSWINVLGTADPSSGTDGITPVASKNDGTYASGMYFSPLISCFSGGNGHVNFGQRPFSYTIPTGFKTLCTANLPDPAIKLPNKHFDTLLWTGNGSDGHAITGLDFQPDWVWIKSRSVGVAHFIVDSLRKSGSNFLKMATSGTSAEVDASDRFTSIDSNGFTLPSGGTFTNGNGSTYVGWNWNAGGSTVTNTDGTISTQVRANPTAGFSIVTYTGTGSAGTIGHGLGVVPDTIITKTRNATGNWTVYNKNLDHASSTSHRVLRLNNTAAQTGSSALYYGNDPTSSVQHLAAYTDSNQSSETYVAYCFSEVAGYSKFGSYTGNGNADGTFVFTGFKPAFVITRGLNGTNWYMYDNKRNTGNVVNKELNPNNTQTEATFTTLDFLSNGFKLRSNNSAFNYNNYNYIYIAFAESPFKNSRAR